MRPRLLDLFCGAGGAAMGYHRAGFDVVGIDCEPQPHYPFEFVRADAIDYVRNHWRDFEAIHASPPCQHASSLRFLYKGKSRPDYIPAVRQALIATGLPWVIENVYGADLHVPVLMLCGSMFALGAWCEDGIFHQLRRHRYFESSSMMLAPGSCRHVGKPIGCYGNGGDRRSSRKGMKGFTGRVRERRHAMGIDWMNRGELSQAIPPAYTHFIGGQLMRAGRILARLQRGYAEAARPGRDVESADLRAADAGRPTDGAGDGGAASEPVCEMPGRPGPGTVGPGPAAGSAGGRLPV